MAFFRDLTALLRFSGFRRLFAVRLLSQGSDGIFQAALASTVMFSPERAPTAGAFAAILLPFTILGPFVGVFLDWWSRRWILVASNAIRVFLLLVIALLVARDNVGWLFCPLVLLAFSVNRFLLAGLSASLPHVVRRELLVTANGVSPTCGTLAYLCGLGFGVAVHPRVAQRRHRPSRRSRVLLPVRSPNLAASEPWAGPGGNRQRGTTGPENVVRGLHDAARHQPPVWPTGPRRGRGGPAALRRDNRRDDLALSKLLRAGQRGQGWLASESQSAHPVWASPSPRWSRRR